MSEFSEHEVDLGQRAYEAYRGAVASVDPVSGRPLRDWDGVPTTVKRAFVAAGIAGATHGSEPREEDSEMRADDSRDMSLAEDGTDDSTSLDGTVSADTAEDGDLFDPTGQSVTRVQEELRAASQRGDRDEVERIREIERAGKARSGILNYEG